MPFTNRENGGNVLQAPAYPSQRLTEKKGKDEVDPLHLFLPMDELAPVKQKACLIKPPEAQETVLRASWALEVTASTWILVFRSSCGVPQVHHLNFYFVFSPLIHFAHHHHRSWKLSQNQSAPPSCIAIPSSSSTRHFLFCCRSSLLHLLFFVQSSPLRLLGLHGYCIVSEFGVLLPLFRVFL